MSNSYVFENYFNDSFELNDFFEIVSELNDIESNKTELKKALKRAKTNHKQEKRTLKKPKKTYAIQIAELKQEILDLRQEMEIRDAQLLSLLHTKN